MKKLLILMLVLGITSIASATMQYGIYEADGVTAADPMQLNITLTYVVNIGGAPGDAPMDGSMCGPTDSAADWNVVDPSTNGVLSTNAGSLGNLTWDGVDYYCWDYGAGSTGLENPPWPVVEGNWFTVDLDPLALGGFELLFYNWNDDSVETIVGEVIPEPASMLLLGLGGLLLRRRK